MYSVPTEMDRECWPRQEAQSPGPATKSIESIVRRPVAQADVESKGGVWEPILREHFPHPGSQRTQNVTEAHTQSKADELRAWPS